MPQSISVKQTKKRIAKQFSRAAMQYDGIANVQLEIALEAKFMLPNNSEVLLDVGCGTGRVTQQLSELSQQTLAMDLALGMLQHASDTHSKKGLKPITWLQGDAEHLPIKTNVIDTLFSSMALQWCPHPELVMTEIRRVLVPQGQAVLAIMTAGSFSELDQSWRCIDGHRHVNEFYDSQTWEQAAKQCGLQVELTKQCYQTWHPNIRHLLTSIKGVGANILLDHDVPTSKSAPINRQQLRTLENFYFTHFGVEQHIPLSYQVTFLRCVK